MGIREAAKAGVKAIVQPGGAMRDAEIIARPPTKPGLRWYLPACGTSDTERATRGCSTSPRSGKRI
ncbi:MAG: hypothetical protein KatS3mg052_2297 [Candidatus Roseilinea sp.]|nr:MAG: hypothetical protein KatS3mg052_2297 [Candidatus Roseilinea sp.]